MGKKDSFLDEVIPETEEKPKEKAPKRVMSLDSIPGSLKKIKKVIDEVNTRDEGISAADKLNLRMAQMLLEYLKETVDGILQ